MKRITFLSLAAFLTILLMLPSAAYAGESSAKSNATNIEVVKKVSIKGVPLMGPPSVGPKAHAAKGVIGEEVSGTRHAIIIGISDYPGPNHILEGGYDLSYAADDAKTMKEALMSCYGFQEGNIHLLVDREANRDAILNEIAALETSVREGDEVVFFFSGHGAKLTPGLVSAQGGGEVGIVVWGWENPQDPTDFYLEAISDRDLKAAFAGFKTDRIIFVFDCCLAGGMIDPGGKGKVICMATTQTGVAAEAFPGEFPYHGLFTYFFVELGIMNHWADSCEADGQVTIEEAFDFTRLNMEAMSREIPIFWQIPTIGDSFAEDLLP